MPLGSLAGLIGSAVIDPTQVVVWNVPGRTTDPAFIQPGAGAALHLLNDVGHLAVVIGAGINGALRFRPDGTGTGSLESSDGTRGWVSGGGVGTYGYYAGSIIARLATATMRLVGGANLTLGTGDPGSERWRMSTTDLAGKPDATPGDGAANASPTITLRQVIDPVGAPVAQNVDAVTQHVNIAIGGGGVAQTLWQFTINAVQALGLFWDEATGQCALEIPAWNTAVTPPVRNGQVVFDVLNPAGFSFYGSKAGAWVGFA